eukprot:170212-Pyramimonas_sp.AAC.1
MVQEWCSGNTKITKWPKVGSGHSKLAWEWCSGNTKNTKWFTVGSGHSKRGLGMVFWEDEEHEVAY